jgi:hypothetical protein
LAQNGIHSDALKQLQPFVGCMFPSEMMSRRASDAFFARAVAPPGASVLVLRTGAEAGHGSYQLLK